MEPFLDLVQYVLIMILISLCSKFCYCSVIATLMNVIFAFKGAILSLIPMSSNDDTLGW